MPELPEVETMRRGILGIVGSRIQSVHRVACRLKPISVEPDIRRFGRRARGQRIERIGRIGKRVTVALQSGDAIVFEPRMTGLVLLADAPSREHLRLRIDLKNGPSDHLWYWDRRGLGNVRLLSPEELQDQLGSERLGPDALEISDDQLRQRLAGSSRAIKVALLDQKVLAGIGNLYAAEILHAARIHPEQPCDRTTRPAWRRLHAAIGEVLQSAIRCEGSTLSDGTYRNALNNPGSYQNQHRVYARAGKLCSSCGAGAIRRIVQAQRATFFCPVCQRMGKPNKGVRRMQRPAIASRALQ